MVDEFIDEVWRQLDNGAFADREALPAVFYAGIKLHLEALDQLAANIALLRVELMKIEKKISNEDS